MIDVHIINKCKDVFKLENYWLMEDKYRINILKFRCRYHHLPISRKYSLDYDCDLKCQLCLQNDIGHEYHYLARYNFFLHERQLFLNKYYIQHPSVFYPTHADIVLQKQSSSSTIHDNNINQTEKYVNTLLSILLCHFPLILNKS